MTLALPALPSISGAAEATASLRAVTPTGAPLRMAFLYVPNGVNVNKWRPTGEGWNYQLGESLQSLAGFRNDIQFISNLGHDNGTAGPDESGKAGRKVHGECISKVVRAALP